MSLNIGTNKSGAKLTRPVALWKRALAVLAGVGLLLVTLRMFQDGEGWATLVPLSLGILAFAYACEKYETLG